MNNKKLAIEETLPMVLGVAGTVGVLPFAVFRYVSGDYMLAFFDAMIMAGLALLTWHQYNTRNVRYASVALALLAVAAALVTVYFRGSTQIYWMYAVLVGAFYMLERHEALIVSAVAVIALVPALADEVSAFVLATICCTIAVTCLLSFAFSTVTRRQRDALMQLARKDPLTGTGNRLALEEKLQEVISAGTRSTDTSSLLMLDLDHFKRVNDEFGHAAGDQILVRITEIINLRIRVTDSIYRIGGEEFVVVVQGQDLASSSRLAEQLRTIVEANELGPSSRAVTISLGVAEYRRGETANAWLRRADDALYRAKHAGRNNTKHAAA
jgi:diguanylate cyclase (GGDEF)-like protein